MRSSLLKRSVNSQDDDDNVKSKKPKLHETELGDNSGIDDPYSDKNTHSKGGLVHTMHGNIYQLKLLMLFLHRALEKDYEFNLGTEVEDAGKFDDIVFKYKTGKDKIRFVQAKHKQDESRTITARDLLNNRDDDFSLQKYFISYRAINKNHKFIKAQSQNFILCTNIDFNYEDLEKSSIQLEESKDSDDFLDVMKSDDVLDVKKSDKSPSRYKLNIPKEHPLYAKLRETAHVHLLATCLAKHIRQNKPLKLKDDILKLYHYPLCEKVFEIITYDKDGNVIEAKEGNKNKKVVKQRVKFRDDFLTGQNLSEAVSSFRTALRSAFGKQNDDSAFQKLLLEKELDISTKFDEPFLSQDDPIISDLETFAEKIAKIINESRENNIRITGDERVVKDNINNLAGHILVQDEVENTKFVRFREVFFDDDNKLPGNLETFKGILKVRLGKKFDDLRQYKFIITIPEFKTCKETLEGGLSYTLPDDKIEDNEIEDFLNELIFAVNQPNEVALGEIIAKEIGESSQFNLLNANLVADSFQRKMLDWFKAKGKEKGKEGVWLNKNSGQLFFDDIGKQVDVLMSVGISLAYIEELRAYNISFNKNGLFDKLIDFLSGTKKILHVIPSEGTILTTINFLDAMEAGYLDYKKHDSYIFQPLSRVLLEGVQDYLIKAFTSSDSHNLFVINCAESNMKGPSVAEKNIKILYQQLLQILRDGNNKNNKLILIADENHSLAEAFGVEWKDKFNEFDVNFSTLTNRSKRYLFKKKITFQGKNSNLKQLYFKSKFSKKQFNEQLSRLNFDIKILVPLITNEPVKIDSNLSGKSDLEGAYFKVSGDIDANALIERFKDSEEQFFIISGVNGANKKKDFINKLKSYSNKEQIDIDLDNIYELDLENDKLHTRQTKRIMLANSKFNEQSFRYLCRSYPEKIVYWITLQDKRLHTMYYPHFLERSFQYPKNSISITNDMKDLHTELCKNDDHNLFYITGVDNLEKFATDVLQLRNSQEKDKISSEKLIIQAKGNKYKFKKLINKKLAQAKKSEFVYWLHIKNNHQISWRDVTRDLVPEKNFIETVDNKTSIIIDQPGMGKSTSLTIFSENILSKKSYWVILITLRNWQKEIAELPDSIDNIDVVVQFLSDTNNLNSPLEKHLIKHIINKNNSIGVKLLLVFDGFDEIRSYDGRNNNLGKEKFQKLLRFLKEKTQSTIWITAREHDSDTLKNTLSVFDIKFEPLKRNARDTYFKNSWKNSLALSFEKEKLDQIFADKNSKFQRYYDILSKSADKMLANSDNDFMGVPLTLRLFAEGFRNKFIKFISSPTEDCYKDFDNLSILNLYKEFVNAKFEIFLSEKTNLSNSFTPISAYWFKEKLIKLHCRLALEELFGKDKAIQLLGPKKSLKWKDYLFNNECEWSLENLELSELFNIGIIRFITQDHYEFVHRTLAEYFASEVFAYALKNKNRYSNEKFQRFNSFIKKNIINERNQVIYKFLNTMTQEDAAFRDLWEAIIENLECEKLLGVTSAKHDFIMDSTVNQEKKYLISLKEEVETRVDWRGSTFYYKPDCNRRENDDECYCVEKLVKASIVTPNIEELVPTVEYLAELLDRSEYFKFNRTLTPEKIILIINHYMFQLQELNVKFIESCFRKIVAIKDRNSLHFQENIRQTKDSFETVENFFHANRHKGPSWFSKVGLNTIFHSKLLTHKIAEHFKAMLEPEVCDEKYMVQILYKLIIPLLIMKDICDSYKKVDCVALLDMFQVFVNKLNKSPEKLSLHEGFVDSLLKCIRESLDRENISEKSLYVSVMSLRVLKDWNLQISYKNNVLYLHNSDTEEFHKLLGLHNEEKILQLLRIALDDSPDSTENLETECENVAKSILSRQDNE